MGARGPLPSPLRSHVVTLYMRGDLATLEEGALVAGVTRSAIRAWLRSAGVDWLARRQHRIAKLRRAAVAVAEGRRVKRPSKAEMRREGERAKAAWDKRHGLDEHGRDQAAISDAT